MEERRKEPRVRRELCVQVSGVDARCVNFREDVVASNLSRSGALLTKVHADLRSGNLVAVEFGGRHAYFRIVWVMESREMEGRLVAIHKLTSQLCPWEEILLGEAALAASAGEK